MEPGETDEDVANVTIEDVMISCVSEWTKHWRARKQQLS